MSTTVAQTRSSILTRANQLTMLRIVFVPIFIILLTYGHNGYAFATFVAAGLSDVLDGVIARRFGQKTSIGAVLDPLADKLLMTTAVVILSLPQMHFANTIPHWLMILMISRDVFILLVALVITISIGFRVFKPSRYGKATTVLQVLTVLAVLFCNWQNVRMPELSVLFYMTGIVTTLSGLHYLITGRKHLGSE